MEKFKFPASSSSTCREGELGPLPALSTNSNMPSGLGWERGVSELVTQNPGSGVNRRHICLGAAGGEGMAPRGGRLGLGLFLCRAEGSKCWSFASCCLEAK